LLDANRPAYVRIPKGQPAEPNSVADTIYLPGAHARTLIATYGSPTQNVLKVAAARDDVSVLVFNRLKPIDWAQIAGPLGDHDDVVVVEDHFPEQGLFGTLCRLCMEAGVHPRIKSLAPQEYNLTVGTSGAYYEAAYGIDAAGISATLDKLAEPQLVRS